MDLPPTPSKACDASLVARLRAGEDEAFEELVREHGGRMLAVTRRILGSDDEAQDALQEAFLSAFKALGRFREGAQLGTWLHRIAVNAALMRLRSTRRRGEREIAELLPSFVEDGHQLREPVAWSAEPDAPVVREETRALVRGCIDRLPENHRVALVLRDIEGLENEEIADRLGLTVNATKIRIHRARQALRALLDPHFRAGDA
jgi:RNA polymerase sigma-70 factor (ECF subfamily)